MILVRLFNISIKIYGEWNNPILEKTWIDRLIEELKND